MRGKLMSLPACALPGGERSPSSRMLSCRNSLTVGHDYDVIDREGSNVVVRDDDGVVASFAASRLDMVG